MDACKGMILVIDSKHGEGKNKYERVHHGESNSTFLI